MYISVFSLANHSKIGVLYHGYNSTHFFFLSNQVYERQQCFAPGCDTKWEFRLLQACSIEVLWFHVGHRSCSLKPVCSSITHIKNGHRLSGSITFFSFHSNFLMVSCTVWPWLPLCQKHCPLSSPSGFAWLQDALGLPLVLQDPNHLFKITRALIFYKLVDKQQHRMDNLHT